MSATATPPSPSHAPAPISVGLTCWLWERARVRRIVRLGEQLGVSLQLTQHVHGLRRDIQCRVAGKNVDRFIGEFARHG